MSNSRFSIFHEPLPSEWQEKMYAYLPLAEIINSRQDVRSRRDRMRALFSIDSESSQNLQKRLLNYWMRYSGACPLSVSFLNERISNPNFYDSPLHHQLSVVALHNKLTGKISNFSIINGYVEDLLSVADVLNHEEYVDFFKQTAALLSRNNQYNLALIGLEKAYKTDKTDVRFLLCDLSLYLQEDQILKILLADVFLRKLRHLTSRSTRCPFSNVVIKLINCLSDKNKIKVIRRFLDYFSENNQTLESIFYLLSGFMDSVANTSIVIDAEYQHMLAAIAGIVPNVLVLMAKTKNFLVVESEAFLVLKSILTASSDGAVKAKIVRLFREMMLGERPRILNENVYEVVWSAAVDEGDHLGVIELLQYFPRLTHLNWSQLIEDKIIEWLVSELAISRNHLVSNYLNKIIVKIVDIKNLSKAINLFLKVCELQTSKNTSDDFFWRAFKSFFGHPGVDYHQRQRLLGYLKSEIHRGAHALYFSLPIGRLTVDERGQLFGAVLARNAKESSSSLIDVLCKMSGMSLPKGLIEGFVATLMEFLLYKTEKSLPASTDRLYSSINNLSKQSFSDNTARGVLSLLNNESLGCEKFILLKAFLASVGPHKYWNAIFELFKILLCQKCVPSEDIFDAFKKYACLASRVNPDISIEYINFFIINVESIDMAAGLNILKGLTERPLVKPALLICVKFLFSKEFCEKTEFSKIKSNILMNLAKYSCLPSESIPVFFDYAVGRLEANILNGHIEAFDLMGCLLRQEALPLFVQEKIQYSAFLALFSDCTKRILSALFLLKAWHKAGWSVGVSIEEVDQARLLELTGHAEEQVRYEVVSLLNLLPNIIMDCNPFTNPESVLLMAIQEERRLSIQPEASCSRISPGV
ncbi:MAG: hypothetical protein WAW86_07715 [Gammaproteobacteria bacterium]